MNCDKSLMPLYAVTDRAWLRGRTLYAQVEEALRAGERDPSPASVFALCEKHGITAYDAQFVALALALECPLYTQDKELLRKFPRLARPFYTCP